MAEPYVNNEVNGYNDSDYSDTEEEEEEAEDDTFQEELAPLPEPTAMRRFQSEPTPLSGGIGQRRGSVVQLGGAGGRRASLSVQGEMQATMNRLKKANLSADVNEMQAALQAAGPVAMMGGDMAQEVQQLAMEMAMRLAEDEDLRKTASLRRSKRIREKLQRLWWLMVSESRIAAAAATDGAEKSVDGSGTEVTRESYQNLHMRIAKVLAEQGTWTIATAEARADKDWADDISRFAGTSHITVWLDEIRQKFRAAAARAVSSHGFAALFARVDKDGSGEIDTDEFLDAARNVLEISSETVPDDDLKVVFAAADKDGSGEIDAEEFVAWLNSKDDSKSKKKGKMLAEVRTNPPPPLFETQPVCSSRLGLL